MSNREFGRHFRIMSGFIACSLTMVYSSPSALAASQVHSADEASIRAQAAEYAEDFASGSADKLAGLFEESAVMVDQQGNVCRGRTEIKKQYADYFARNGGQPLEIIVESVNYPAENIAVEQGISRLKNSSAPSSSARYVVTHVKRDGKWLMESVTESPYIAVHNGDYLKPLSWMIGSWKVESPESNIEVKAEWANNNVISLSASSKDPGKPNHSEFIFWNPQTKTINSFQYDADGGISKKRWERDGESWVVHASSVQPDGSDSRADYIIKQINNDSFTWQSKRRSIAGAALPDSQQLKVTRVKG